MLEPGPESPFAGVKAWGLVRCLLYASLATFVGGAALGLNFEEVTTELAGTLTAAYGGLLLWVWLAHRRAGAPLGYLVGAPLDRRAWKSVIPLVLVLMEFSVGAFYVLYYPLSFAAPQVVAWVLAENDHKVPPGTRAPALYHALSAFGALILAPVLEEMVFRGVLLHRWAAKWGLRTAIVASSLLFGLLHADLLGAAMFGVVMALLAVRTRTLLVPMACHALNNAVAYGALLWTGDEPAMTLAEFRADAWIAPVALALSLPWLVPFIRRNWPAVERPAPGSGGVAPGAEEAPASDESDPAASPPALS